MPIKIMTTQEVIDRLMAGSYKGQKITAVDFDPALSNICDLWLSSGKRVSFSSAVKALEWVTIEEIIWFAENAPNIRLHVDGGDSPAQMDLLTPEVIPTSGDGSQPARRQ